MRILNFKKPLAIILALGFTFSNYVFFDQVSAGDSLPPQGIAQTGSNQPTVNGYRVLDIKEWSPQSDDWADLLRAQVPLQKRNMPFAKTQANPSLSPDTELYNLTGDYGNYFFDTVPYNNEFSPYAYNFWQYTDYYGGWHGMATNDVPRSLYDPEADWTERLFEFGVLNLPNPAYTNAAHKNGVKSVACIFIPRAGQTHETLLERGGNGEFVVGKKLIEMANYYGYDGYFINQEDTIPVEHVQPYKEFTKYLMDNGLYIQWYDAIDPQTGNVVYEPKFTERNREFLYDNNLGLVNNSMFINYNWNQKIGGSEMDHSEDQTNIFESIKLANRLSINPLKTLFFGVEAVKGGFGGNHNSTKNMDVILDKNSGNPLASIALFTPDFVQSSLDQDLGDPNKNLRADKDYQHMVFERERMWYTGPSQDVKDTGEKPGFSRRDIGVDDASEWGGVSKYITERSVIKDNVFQTDFNTGHGLSYYSDGNISNPEEWSNINIQSILPTWQWWIDTQGDRLDVDFDYGPQYNKGRFKYEAIGGYNGGSSLVINGNLNDFSFLRLFKTDLNITGNSSFEMAYNKVSESDTSTMKLGIVFKDNPDNPVYLDIPNSSNKTDGWTNAKLDLSAYAGRTIAAFGLAFDPNSSAINDYQINIGQLKITDGLNYTPNIPTGFKIKNDISSTGELILSWDKLPYDIVKQYNIYLQDNSGNDIFLGGIYDEKFYVKSVYDNQSFILKLTAVGNDGSESMPCIIKYDSSSRVSKLKVSEKAYGGKDNVIQNDTTGYIDLSWQNADINNGYEIELSFFYSDKTHTYKKSVGKNVESTSMIVPIADGSKYTISIKALGDDGLIYDGVHYNGRLRDVYSQPFDGGITVTNGIMEIDVPSSHDWWKIYLTINGSDYIWKINGDNSEFGIRGKSKLNGIDAGSNSGNVTIRLEDYSGNISDPVVLNYANNLTNKVSSKEFPDLVLLEEIKSKVGSTFNEIFEFRGELDLSGLNISDYSGLHLIPAKSIILANYNLESNYKLRLHPNIEKISFANSEALKHIVSGAFKSSYNLREIDISGCFNLELLDLQNLSLEKILYDDISIYNNLISLNLSGSKFDISTNTPERLLVDKVSNQIVNGKFIETYSSELMNVANNAKIITSNFNNPERLLDNNIDTYTNSNGYANITFYLKDIYEIYELQIMNYSSSYGSSSFEVYISKDNVNYSLLTSVVGSDLATHKMNPEASDQAGYIKFVSSASLNRGNHMREFIVYTYPKIKYVSEVKYDNQSPRIISEIPEILNLNYNSGLIDLREFFQNGKSVRGTDVHELKVANFINPNYDILNYNLNYQTILFVRDPNQQSLLNYIDTSISGDFKVDLISFNSNDYNGTIINSLIVTVNQDGENSDPPINPTDKLTVVENTQFGVRVEYIDNLGFDLNTTLDIVNLNSDMSKYSKLIDNLYPTGQLFELYDINLKLNGQVISPEGRVRVTFINNQNMQRYTDIKTVHLTDQDNLILLDTNYDNNIGVSFETTHLSIYGMAGKPVINSVPDHSDNESISKNPPTSDQNHAIFFGSLISIIFSLYVIYYNGKYRKYGKI